MIVGGFFGLGLFFFLGESVSTTRTAARAMNSDSGVSSVSEGALYFWGKINNFGCAKKLQT